MKNKLKHSGFSLTEVLMAVGTLAIGLIFIGGTFVAGIHFSTIATERTIAAIVADEAFAKIKLYGIDPMDPNLSSNQLVNFEVLNQIDPNEFAYPSTRMNLAEKQYYWSALCMREATDPNDRRVQVRVFVSRKVGSGVRYRNPLNPINSTVGYPMPVKVSVLVTGNVNELRIEDVLPIDGIEKTFINDSDTIVDDKTGEIYRVLKRYPSPDDNMILLNRPWASAVNGSVWVVPPPANSGRKPCITVYPNGIRF